MNIADFTQLLHRPESIGREQTDALRHVIDEFPYFQSARSLYLKGLYDQDSFKYNSELKVTAAHTMDRSVLFDLITSRQFTQHTVSKRIQERSSSLKKLPAKAEEGVEVAEEVSDNEKHTLISKSNLDHPEEASTKKPPPEIDVQHIENEEATAQGPLIFNRSEKHSFEEWLRLTSIRKIDRSEETQVATTLEIPSRTQRFALIDKFIEKNPKIVPSTAKTSHTNLAKKRGKIKEDLMTETLAQVYTEQKRYKNAIQAYTILSLKYPEKSGFFADQIREVERLKREDKNSKTSN